MDRHMAAQNESRSSSSSSRALSPFEENYAKSTAGGSGIIVYGILLDAAHMELRHVVMATEIVMEKKPLLRAQIVEGCKAGKTCVKMAAPEMDPRMWVEEKTWPPWPDDANEEDADGAAEGILRLDPAHHDDGGALHRAMVQELNTHFVNGEGIPSPPLIPFKVCVYSNANSGGHRRPIGVPRPELRAVILRMHNAIFDCASARATGRELAEAIEMAMGGILGGKAAAATGNNGGNNGLPPPPPPIEELLPKGKVSKSLVKKGLDTASYIIKAKNWRVLPFNDAAKWGKQQQQQQKENGARLFFGFRTQLATRGLGKQGTALFLAACKKEGVPWRAAVASAFLKTAAAIRGPKGEKLDEFSFSCVMDCRRTLEPPVEEGALGNYTLSLLMSAKIKDEKVEFWDLARNIALSIEKDAHKGKHFSKMPLLNMLFSQVLKYPSMTPSSSCRTMLFSLLMDKPLKESWNVEQTHVVGTIGPFTSVHYIGPCFLLSETLTNDSELLLSLAYPSPLYSRKQILGLLSTSVAMIQESTKQRF